MPSILDNFDDLTAWTASNMSASGNEAYATTGGTFGSLVRAWGADSDKFVRHSCVLKVDKTETANRTVQFGLSDNANFTNSLGIGWDYVAGGGIYAGVHGADSGIVYMLGQGTTSPLIVADSALSTGYYLITITLDRVLFQNVIQVYSIGSAGNYAPKFIGGGSVNYGNSTFWSPNKLFIASNSAKCKISRFMADSNPFGSLATEANDVAVTCGTMSIDGGTHHVCGLYTPGAAFRSDTVALVLLGAGGYIKNGLWASGDGVWDRSNAWPIADALIAAGIPVISPAMYSDTGTSTDSWGSPDAMAEAESLVTILQGYFGANVKFILAGASMGGLGVARLINSQTVPNVIAAMIMRGAVGLVNFWNGGGSFQAQINAAYGISPADLAAAHAALDQYDPVYGANSTLFRNVPTVFFEQYDDDSVADPSLNGQLLRDYFDGAGISYTYIHRAIGGHAGMMAPADAAKFAHAALPRAAAIGGATALKWGVG